MKHSCHDFFGDSVVGAEETMHRQRLFVDMDGTLTEFLPQESMAPRYEKGYFRNLPPHENVVAAIRCLLSAHPEIEVHILSAYLTDSPYALAEKNAWVDNYLPELDVSHRLFVPNGSDKRACIGDVREDDVLLDDYTKNLLRWQPSRAVKLINAINHTKKTWKNAAVYYDHDPATLAAEIVQAMRRG